MVMLTVAGYAASCYTRFTKKANIFLLRDRKQETDQTFCEIKCFLSKRNLTDQQILVAGLSGTLSIWINFAGLQLVITACYSLHRMVHPSHNIVILFQ